MSWVKKIMSQKFKEDAVRYRQDYPELSIPTVATNLGVSTYALGRWIEIAKKSNGPVASRGSGNYASEEAKEIARLRRELHNKEDALEV